MNNSRPIPQPSETSPSLEIEAHSRRLDTAYRRIEDDVHNLERAGAIADRLMGDLLESPGDERAMELTNFAVQNLYDLLKRFRDRYLAYYEAPPQDEE